MPANGTRKLELKLKTTEFMTYGTGLKLNILGRTKCGMQNECREDVLAMVYIVQGAVESLLCLVALEISGKILIRLEGQH